MKYATSTIIMLIATAAVAVGQAAPAEDIERAKQRAREQAYNESVDRLRNVGKTTMPIDPNARLKTFTNKIRPLYRMPSVEEMTKLQPEKNLQSAFSELLADKRAGVVKLVPDRGCEVQFNVVVATPHCEEYKLPGAGSAFSFRQSSHWLKHLSDLNFEGERFTAAPGEFIHGILVSVGDVPLDKIKDTPAYATISGFAPVSDAKKAASFSGALEKGIRDGQLVYSSAVPVMKYTTFLLRSIAYRTELYKSIDGVEYDEMEFDVRDDVIVAFRVIGYEPDRSVIFAWKEIARQASPKLKR